MASKKYIPTCSRRDFDGLSSKLRSELKRRYDESKADSARPPRRASTKGAFDHVPDLDSKTVAKWSATVKKYLGCNIDPALIRRGGYASFDDFWSEFSHKLRNTCPHAGADKAAPSVLGATP